MAGAEEPGPPPGHGLPCRARFRACFSTLPGRLRRLRGSGRVAIASESLPVPAVEAAVAVAVAPSAVSPVTSGEEEAASSSQTEVG